MSEKQFRLFQDVAGSRYVRTQDGWFGPDGTKVTLERATAELDRFLHSRLSREDDEIDDPRDVLDRAWIALAMGTPARAERLCRRIVRNQGRTSSANGRSASADLHLAAAAMLSSALRLQRRPDDALDATEGYEHDSYAPLMTSRAAALCDVGRFDEALELANQAMDVDPSEEVYNLLQRIENSMEREAESARG